MSDCPPPTDPGGYGTNCDPPPKSVLIVPDYFVPVGLVVLAGVVDGALTEGSN